MLYVLLDVRSTSTLFNSIDWPLPRKANRLPSSVPPLNVASVATKRASADAVPEASRKSTNPYDWVFVSGVVKCAPPPLSVNVTPERRNRRLPVTLLVTLCPLAFSVTLLATGIISETSVSVSSVIVLPSSAAAKASPNVAYCASPTWATCAAIANGIIAASIEKM